METHRPLKGIEVGDIGPKFGFASKDNGYLIMKDVRIPRTDMLMKYVSIDKEGSMGIQGNPKILYSIMMYTRLMIAKSCGIALCKGLLIGIRYGIVRT